MAESGRYARFDELVDLLGLPLALRVCEARGGRIVHIPGAVTQGSAIARHLGIEAARRISEHYGGGPQDLLIPLGPTSDEKRKRREIRNLIRRGYSRAAIAGMVRCHIRTVQRVRNHQDDGQADLFIPDTIRD